MLGRSCDHWVQFPTLRSRCDWSSSQVSMPRTRPIPTTQKYRGCLEATTAPFWQSIHTARPIRGEGRFFFFSFSVFQVSAIQSCSHHHHAHLNKNFCCRTSAPTIIKLPTTTTPTSNSNSPYQPNQLLTAFLRTEQSILDFPRRHLSHPARDARFCSRANQVSDARRFNLTVATPVHPYNKPFPRRLPLVFDDYCVVNRPSTTPAFQAPSSRIEFAFQTPPNRDKAF
jgi:hypothetical protein